MDSLEITRIILIKFELTFERLISTVFRTFLVDLSRGEIYSPRVPHADETFENKARLINRNGRPRRLTKTKFARCCRLPENQVETLIFIVLYLSVTNERFPSPFLSLSLLAFPSFLFSPTTDSKRDLALLISLAHER